MPQQEKSDAKKPGLRERLEIPEPVVGRAGSLAAALDEPVAALAALADFLLPMLPFLFLLAVLPLDMRRTGWEGEGARAGWSRASRVSFAGGFSDVDAATALVSAAVVVAMIFSEGRSAASASARISRARSTLYVAGSVPEDVAGGAPGAAILGAASVAVARAVNGRFKGRGGETESSYS